MFQILLSNQARKTLVQLRGSATGVKITEAIDAIAVDPRNNPQTTNLLHVPSGFRRRVQRYRILYTVDDDANTVHIWIIAMEKDTKKDYDRWMQYILQHVK